MKKIIFFFGTLFFTVFSSIGQEKQVLVGDFQNKALQEWEYRNFLGETHFETVTDEEHPTQNMVLKITSKKSGTLYYKYQKVDLNKTPFLNWSWKTERRSNISNEDVKEGDDFSARIQTLVAGSLSNFFENQGFNYVWSNAKPIGSSWHNPFTDNVVMFSLQDKNSPLNTWKIEKRNLLKDYQDAFDIEAGEELIIERIGIMTDSDNSVEAKELVGYYGNIFFTAN